MKYKFCSNLINVTNNVTFATKGGDLSRSYTTATVSAVYA